MAFSNAMLPQNTPAAAFGVGVESGNALTKDALANRQQEIANQYAPYQNYADAYLKMQQAQWLPYQYQMQAATNPLLWMSNPDLAKQLLQNVSSNIPQGNTAASGMGMPMPSQGMGGGLLGAIKNMSMGSNSPSQNSLSQPQNSGFLGNVLSRMGMGGAPTTSDVTSQATNTSPNGYSGLVPATGGPGAAITAQMQGPYNKQQIAPGQVQRDPITGEVISAPTSRTTTQLQQQLSAANRTIPQLQSLSDLWKPFMNLKGMGEMEGSRVGNVLTSPEFRDKIGFEGDLPSQYADAKMASLTSVESYLKSIGVPVTVDVQAKLNDMIEPLVGENPKGYSNRIQTETQRIVKDFVGQTQQQMAQGYDVTGGLSNTQTPAQSAVAQQLQNSPQAQEQGIATVQFDPDKRVQMNIPGKGLMMIRQGDVSKVQAIIDRMNKESNGG